MSGDVEVSAMVLESLRRYCAPMTDPFGARSSLYAVLAERPADGTPTGETRNTRQKETIDNDVEEFDPELATSSVYELLCRIASVDVVPGETKTTKQIETCRRGAGRPR
jgi:hypothetical protein